MTSSVAVLPLLLMPATKTFSKFILLSYNSIHTAQAISKGFARDTNPGYGEYTIYDYMHTYVRTYHIARARAPDLTFSINIFNCYSSHLITPPDIIYHNNNQTVYIHTLNIHTYICTYIH